MEKTSNIDSGTAFAAIQKHTRKCRSGLERMVEIPVHEWGFSVWTNAPTCEEEEAIINARQRWEQKKLQETGKPNNGQYTEIIATIIVRAKNKDGTKIFAIEQLDELKAWMMATTARAVARTIVATDLTPEELEKN
jgi:hypothetical protein